MKSPGSTSSILPGESTHRSMNASTRSRLLFPGQAIAAHDQ